MILARLGKGYFKEKGVRIFSQNFWLGCLSSFKGCLVLVVASNMKKVLNFIISCISLQFTVMDLFYLHKKSDKKKS